MSYISPYNHIEAVIKELLKPGWDVRLYQRAEMPAISIRFMHKASNQYQQVEISEEFIQRSNGPYAIINYLSMATNCLSVLPVYQRTFEKLMHEIMFSEFTPGKLWG